MKDKLYTTLGSLRALDDEGLDPDFRKMLVDRFFAALNQEDRARLFKEATLDDLQPSCTLQSDEVLRYGDPCPNCKDLWWRENAGHYFTQEELDEAMDNEVQTLIGARYYYAVVETSDHDAGYADGEVVMERGEVSWTECPQCCSNFEVEPWS